MIDMLTATEWAPASDVKQLKDGVRIKTCLDMTAVLRSDSQLMWFTGTVKRAVWSPQITRVWIDRDDRSNHSWEIGVTDGNIHNCVMILNTDWDD
jgi:hypothetical protein